jgi:hypothetical protein
VRNTAVSSKLRNHMSAIGFIHRRFLEVKTILDLSYSRQYLNLVYMGHILYSNDIAVGTRWVG